MTKQFRDRLAPYAMPVLMPLVGALAGYLAGFLVSKEGKFLPGRALCLGVLIGTCWIVAGIAVLGAQLYFEWRLWPISWVVAAITWYQGITIIVWTFGDVRDLAKQVE